MIRSRKRPNWRQMRQKFPEKLYLRLFPFSLLLVAFEWTARQYFYAIGRCFSCRLVFQGTAATLALIGAFGIYHEYKSSQEERIVRMWQTATSPVPGNSGKIPALEFLNQRGEPLAGLGIPGAWLVGVQLDSANLVNSNLQGAAVMEASLRSANFYSSRLQGAMFTSANLSNANFSSVALEKTSFAKAQMAHTKFRKTVIDAIFEEADLRGANFSEAVFQMTWLSKACLKGADFTNAIFSDDFLNSFTDADLTGAVFTNSKGLTQSDLNRAGCAHRSPVLSGTGLHWPDNKICKVGELSACDRLRKM